MNLTPTVTKLLSAYESDCPGVKANLARLLMQGELAGTGKMIILPVDQGFEHGPGRSFQINPVAYDPHFHFQLAIDAGVSAYAAPLGMLEAGAATFAGQMPLILKMNSSNTLLKGSAIPDQAVTASVKDALRLGCVGVGFTIYPGSDASLNMLEEICAIAREAKEHGLVVIIWSYPRGEAISKSGETALDVVSYGAHMAALAGAHIIKVKLPSAHIELEANQKPYQSVPKETLAQRVEHVVKACFAGRRMVIFSGGETKSLQDVLDDTKAIYDGGGHGSIIGRNSFQRPREEALGLLKNMQNLLKGK